MWKFLSYFEDVPKRIYVIGVLVSCIPILVMLFCHLTRPLGWHFNWELQSDQYVYAGNARAIIERGNGFAYPNPYDSNSNTPVIYSYLFSLLVAYTWKFTHLPIMLSYIPLRIIFGTLLTVSIWKIIHVLFKDQDIRYGCFYCLLFGGGTAGIISLFYALAGQIKFSQLFICSKYLEGAATWCFVDLFRNYFYATEIIYHLMFFVTLWCVFKAYWRTSLFFFALTLYAHPYNGLQLAFTYLLFLFLSLFIENKKDRPQYLRTFIAACVLFIFFLYYNLFWMACFPESAKISKINAALRYIIHLPGLIMGCGIWFFVGIFAVIRYYKQFVVSKNWRLIVCLFLATFVLMYHHVLITKIIQPAHFSRGYPFFCLVLFTFYLIQENDFLHRVFAGLSKNVVIGAFMIMFVSFDNICFLPVAYRTDTPALRYMPHSEKEVMDFLENRKEQDVVAVNNYLFGYLVPVLTHQRAEISYAFLTPDFTLKRILLARLIQYGDPEFLLRFKNTNVIILTKKENGLVIKYDFFKKWNKLYENKDYFVYLIHA